MECEVRIARESDAGEISEVILRALREINAKDYSPDVIQRVELSFSPAAVRERMSRRMVFVALAGTRIVGTASLEGSVVRTVFVAPDTQRRGIGKRLMSEVESAAREAGVKTLAVPSSISAEAFYSKLGFKAVGDSYHGEERTIIMERSLLPP
jgi:N-acetylglutamate synthase-like GNAT family acetyltransferase